MPAPPTQQQYPVPNKTTIAEFPTPGADRYLYRYVDTKVPGYVLPEEGDLHEDQQTWPGFFVADIIPSKERGDGWWIIIYTAERENQDAYNYALSYPYGSTSFPRITRTYYYLRKDYEAGSPLALGTADPQLKEDGTAQWAGATLIESDSVRRALDEPELDSLFVRVERVFEILPGPAITTTKLAEDGSTITVTTQKMLAGSVVTSETLTGGTTPWVRKYKGEGNAYYAEQITESRPIPGNTIYNTQIDEDGKVITVAVTLKAVGNITTGETLSASPSGTWSRTRRVDANSTLVAYEQVDSRAIPGNLLDYVDYDPLTQTYVASTQQLIAADVADYTPTSELQDYKDVPYNGTLVKMRTIRNYPTSIVNKTIIEYKRERYSYPPLLSDYASSGALQNGTQSDGSVFFIVNPVIEAERVRLIPARLTTTFQISITSPVLPVPLVIQPQRLSYRGALFDIITGPVLCNAQSLTATVPSGDPNWPTGAVETCAIDASTPTKTEWVNARNNAITSASRWFVSDFDVKKIAYSLYMVTKVEIPYY